LRSAVGVGTRVIITLPTDLLVYDMAAAPLPTAA
jgi:hypothetical protein